MRRATKLKRSDETYWARNLPKARRAGAKQLRFYGEACAASPSVRLREDSRAA